MDTKMKKSHFGTAMKLVLLPIWIAISAHYAFAGNAVYTASDLTTVDQNLSALEKENATGALKPVPMEFYDLVARKNVTMVNRLIFPKAGSQLTMPLSSQQRRYYKDHIPELRRMVLQRELGRTRLERMREIFRKRLSSKNQYIQKQAIWWTLVMLGGPSDISAVESLTKSPDESTRFNAAIKLALIGDPAGDGVLKTKLRSRTPFNAWQAADALTMLHDPAAKSELLDILHSTSTSETAGILRTLALNSLSRLPGQDVDNLILKELNANDEHLVCGALGALQQRGIPIDVAIASRLFYIAETANFDPNYRRIAADIAVLRGPSTFVRNTILRYRGSSDPIETKAFLLGLSRVGEPQDVRAIISYLDDPSAGIRAESEYALRHLTGVNLGDPGTDLTATVVRRKAWWKEHQHDPQYR